MGMPAALQRLRSGDELPQVRQWWGSVWHQRWGKRSPGPCLSFHKAPTLPQWCDQSWWCMASHGSSEGSARGSRWPQRHLCWPDLMPREIWPLLGAWIWDTVEAYLAPMLQVPLLFYMGTYSTARGGLNHAKSVPGALEWGSRIWTFFGISLDLLEKENSRKIRWILMHNSVH